MSRSLYARLAHRFGPPIDPASRRDFLKTTLATGAGLMLSFQPSAFGRRPGAAGRRVCVVGAGFAGLAAAYELKAAGCDVTVVEARGRLGGRVLSFDDMSPGAIAEGGAELIGSNHPAWVAYAERFGLEFLDVTEAEDLSFPVILGGKRLSDEDAEKLWEEMEEAVGGMNGLAESIDAFAPWKSPDAAELDKRHTAAWIDSLDISPLGKLGLKVQFTADNGQDAAKQSLLGNLAQVKGGGVDKYWTESEVYRCKGGNQQLALSLAEAVTADRIIVGLSAKKIEVKSDKVMVTCGDGRTIECDDVVLAVPPSVWKKIEIAPALPPALTPQMGSNIKYLAGVSGRFWVEKGLAPDALTDGDISMTWEGTDNQELKEGAVLVAFSGGPASDQCREHKGKAADDFFTAGLESIYPGYRAALRKGRFMDWPSDTWTQAGYSFPAPGEVTTVGPMLARGMGRLHFAGEHCCYAFVGYMEGALQSGIAAAKRVMARA